ncbi:hypothetical protein BG452_10855 [Streptomyces sp. CBMA123]|nr:hypothetical protein [Streptomyces sp. CBMA123]
MAQHRGPDALRRRCRLLRDRAARRLGGGLALALARAVFDLHEREQWRVGRPRPDSATGTGFPQPGRTHTGAAGVSGSTCYFNG